MEKPLVSSLESPSSELSNGWVLLDFFSQSCGPCKMMDPLVEEVAEQTSDLKVFKVDVEHASELVESYGVTHVPTLVVLKDGEETNRSIGLKDKDEILALIQSP